MIDTALALRTCAADGTSHGDFRWPESGPVECPDWNPKPVCGNGLHGLLDGWGDYGLLSSDADARWQVVEVERASCVEISGKVKFPRCTVVYSGNMARALTMIGDYQIKLLLAAAKTDEGIQSASGDSSKLAASGDSSKLAASGYSSKLAASGYYSQLAASGYYSQLAASGDHSQLAASGDSSKLAASGDYSQLAASGDYSQVAASGDYSQLAASGYYSQLAASGEKSIVCAAGYHSTVSAGPDGVIVAAYWDKTAKRPRVVVGYVGDDGIEANVAYRVRDGKLVHA